MCKKCLELNHRIDHYRVLASGITDRQALDGIEDLIEKMKAEQAALHADILAQDRL